MKYLIFIFLSLFFPVSILFSTEFDTVYVKTAKELINSIDSNRTIIIETAHIKFSEKTLEINHIKNLTIEGHSDSLCKFTTNISGDDVISINSCSNIKILNLSIGHMPESGYCQGDVIQIKNSESVIIDNCDLFGSGVFGLNLSSCSVFCKNTIIRDCSDDIINNIDHNYVRLEFNKCSFFLNQKNKFYYPNPLFSNCSFYDYKKEIICTDFNGYYPEKPLIINSRVVSEMPAWKGEQGLTEWTCPNTISIKTSSNLKPNGKITYSSKNLFTVPDYDTNNIAWIEGVKGYGIGEKIIITVKELQASWDFCEISSEFIFINGYTRDMPTWIANSRIKKFSVKRNNRLICFINLEDSPNYQQFSLNKITYYNDIKPGDIFEFEITDIYKGNKYDDTAFSFFSSTCSP